MSEPKRGVRRPAPPRVPESVPAPVDKAIDPHSLSAQLHSATDTLNEKLEHAEESLAALNMGVTAAVALCKERDPTYGIESGSCLVFDKAGARWRLLVRHYVDD